MTNSEAESWTARLGMDAKAELRVLAAGQSDATVGLHADFSQALEEMRHDFEVQ